MTMMDNETELDYTSLNAMINLYDVNHNLQIGKDAEAARAYFLQHVNKSTQYFHDLDEKIHYLTTNNFWDASVIDAYDRSDVKDLFDQAYAHKYRFPTFMGALKFYTSYALRSDDGQTILERYEDRIVMTALTLGKGDKELASRMIDEIITNRYQPATPTFQNAGKARGGEQVSCFPAGTMVDTIDGPRAIDTLNIGDMVLSHDGKYHAVEKVTRRENTEGLWRINYTASSLDDTDNPTEPVSIVSTPEHPLLVRTERNVPGGSIIDGDGSSPEEKIYWIQAKDVIPGDFLLQNNIIEDDDTSSRATELTNDFILCEVTESHTTGKHLEAHTVYNLHVADTHTYSIHGVIVHNCFLLRVEDDLDSISEAWNSAAQLSKIGGGVALNFSNLRELGAPLKGKRGLAKGIIPWMKIFEDIFTAVDQLGMRPGAGAIYLSAHHPQIMDFLDTKRENADEKLRIKSLSIGVVIPDITIQLAKSNSKMYLFSPYDVKKHYGIDFCDLNVTEMYDELVDNPAIHKTEISARKLLERIAQLQFESGYPYVLYSDTANKANPIDGTINMSNLCSEILQVNTPTKRDPKTGRVLSMGQDISCNLGSMNVLKSMQGKDLPNTVDVAMRSLTAVADGTSIDRVPSIKKANDNMHSVGLGQMNLAGFFAFEEMMYGDEDSIDFTSMYFMYINYLSLKSSNQIARERGGTFKGFKKSKYASGEYFDTYTEGEEWKPKTAKVRKILKKYNVTLPTQDDWRQLKEDVMRDGLWHSYRQAVPPTGSISYIAQSTSSIHPIVSPVEIRKEKLGRVYVPMPELSERTLPYYVDAFTLGPDPLIDVYAAANPHVDQGLSLTLFIRDTASTRDINRAQLRAHAKGIRTIYYARIRQTDLAGTSVQECVSCSL